MLPDFRVRQRDYLLEISRALTQELDLEKLLARILRLREEIASTLGYASFPDYTLEDRMAKTGALDAFPLVKAWSDALVSDDAVTGSVPDDWEEKMVAMLRRRETYSATFLPKDAAAAE